MNTEHPADHGTEHPTDHTARIAVSWALVAIPLGYGLYNAIKAAAQLFTGTAAG